MRQSAQECVTVSYDITPKLTLVIDQTGGVFVTDAKGVVVAFHGQNLIMKRVRGEQGK